MDSINSWNIYYLIISYNINTQSNKANDLLIIYNFSEWLLESSESSGKITLTGGSSYIRDNPPLIFS